MLIFLPLSSVVAETSLAAHFMLGTMITRLLLSSGGSPHLFTLSRYFLDGKRFLVLGGLIPSSSWPSGPDIVKFIVYNTKYKIFKGSQRAKLLQFKSHRSSAILESCYEAVVKWLLWNIDSTRPSPYSSRTRWLWGRWRGLKWKFSELIFFSDKSEICASKFWP